MVFRLVLLPLLLVYIYLAIGNGTASKEHNSQIVKTSNTGKRQQLPDWDVHFTESPLLGTENLIQGPNEDDIASLSQAIGGYRRINKAYEPASVFTVNPPIPVKPQVLVSNGVNQRKFVYPTPQKEDEEPEDDDDDDDDDDDSSQTTKGKSNTKPVTKTKAKRSVLSKHRTKHHNNVTNKRGVKKGMVSTNETTVENISKTIKRSHVRYYGVDDNERKNNVVNPLFPNPHPEIKLTGKLTEIQEEGNTIESETNGREKTFDKVVPQEIDKNILADHDLQPTGLTKPAIEKAKSSFDSLLEEERQNKLNEEMMKNTTRPYGLPWFNGERKLVKGRFNKNLVNQEDDEESRLAAKNKLDVNENSMTEEERIANERIFNSSTGNSLMTSARLRNDDIGNERISEKVISNLNSMKLYHMRNSEMNGLPANINELDGKNVKSGTKLPAGFLHAHENLGEPYPSSIDAKTVQHVGLQDVPLEFQKDEDFDTPKMSDSKEKVSSMHTSSKNGKQIELSSQVADSDAKHHGSGRASRFSEDNRIKENGNLVSEDAETAPEMNSKQKLHSSLSSSNIIKSGDSEMNERESSTLGNTKGKQIDVIHEDRPHAKLINADENVRIEANIQAGKEVAKIDHVLSNYHGQGREGSNEVGTTPSAENDEDSLRASKMKYNKDEMKSMKGENERMNPLKDEKVVQEINEKEKDSPKSSYMKFKNKGSERPNEEASYAENTDIQVDLNKKPNKKLDKDEEQRLIEPNTSEEEKEPPMNKARKVKSEKNEENNDFSHIPMHERLITLNVKNYHKESKDEEVGKDGNKEDLSLQTGKSEDRISQSNEDNSKDASPQKEKTVLQSSQSGKTDDKVSSENDRIGSSSKHKAMSMQSEEDGNIPAKGSKTQSMYSKNDHDTSSPTKDQDSNSENEKANSMSSQNLKNEKTKAMSKPQEEGNDVPSKGGKSKAISSQNEEENSLPTKDKSNYGNEKADGMSTQNEKTKAMSTTEEEGNDVSTKGSKSKAMPTQNDEENSSPTKEKSNYENEKANGMSAQNEKTKAVSTPQEEGNNVPAKSSKSKAISTQNDEENSLPTKDESSNENEKANGMSAQNDKTKEMRLKDVKNKQMSAQNDNEPETNSKDGLSQENSPSKNNDDSTVSSNASPSSKTGKMNTMSKQNEQSMEENADKGNAMAPQKGKSVGSAAKAGRTDPMASDDVGSGKKGNRADANLKATGEKDNTENKMDDKYEYIDTENSKGFQGGDKSTDRVKGLKMSRTEEKEHLVSKVENTENENDSQAAELKGTQTKVAGKNEQEEGKELIKEDKKDRDTEREDYKSNKVRKGMEYEKEQSKGFRDTQEESNKLFLKSDYDVGGTVENAQELKGLTNKDSVNADDIQRKISGASYEETKDMQVDLNKTPNKLGDKNREEKLEKANDSENEKGQTMTKASKFNSEEKEEGSDEKQGEKATPNKQKNRFTSDIAEDKPTSKTDSNVNSDASKAKNGRFISDVAETARNAEGSEATNNRLTQEANEDVKSAASDLNEKSEKVKGRFQKEASDKTDERDGTDKNQGQRFNKVADSEIKESSGVAESEDNINHIQKEDTKEHGSSNENEAGNESKESKIDRFRQGSSVDSKNKENEEKQKETSKVTDKDNEKEKFLDEDSKKDKGKTDQETFEEEKMGKPAHDEKEEKEPRKSGDGRVSKPKNESGSMSEEELERSSKLVLNQLKQLQALAQSSDPDPKRIDVSALHPGTVKILKKLGEEHGKIERSTKKSTRIIETKTNVPLEKPVLIHPSLTRRQDMSPQNVTSVVDSVVPSERSGPSKRNVKLPIDMPSAITLKRIYEHMFQYYFPKRTVNDDSGDELGSTRKSEGLS